MNLDHLALSHICDNCPERVNAIHTGPNAAKCLVLR